MTTKDTDTKDAASRAGSAAAELTAARAALVALGTSGAPAEKAAALKRIQRDEEAKIQADRRKAALA